MTEDEKAEYVASMQAEVISILNKVKEEMGIDTPVEIEVRDVSDDE
jgi:predicted regulator of Ras-like GTPase activity (Roadblock/LC7/MglB family)